MSDAQRRAAFTLIELLVVISIIVILLGLFFPAFQGVQNQAKKIQAKNDLTQIVTAVNAFYTEYGRYPTTSTADVTLGSSPTNDQLFDVLRNNTTGGNSSTVASLNPRQIVFLSLPDAKDQTNPRNGIKISNGQFYDPWGIAYDVRIDSDYDNSVPNPYSQNAGSSPLRDGVIAWSFGKDTQSQSLPGPAPNKNTGTNSDDVISWQ
jgi:prepilin-type N-terminal cleavage/methylation domain-containing protein